MLPIGVLMAFIVMRTMGLNSNIMSLGGIAIAIGAMVDAAIVMIENAHKHLERLAPGAPRLEAIIAACKEVGPALFFSLLIITVSFLPVFTLESQEGRMFSRSRTPRPSPWRARRCCRHAGAGADVALHPRAHPPEHGTRSCAC